MGGRVTEPDAGAAEPASPWGEIVPPGEAAAIQAIVTAIEARVRAQARATPPARRDAHPKAHGCVRAELAVLADLPAAYRVGLFAEPRRYPAWIRFSNGSEKPQADKPGDGRGMAIKLMGVAASPSTTQDFVLINNPTFFVRNAADYVDLETGSSALKFFFPSLNPCRFRLRELWVAIQIATRKVSNPLNLRYWSMTPYRFGDQACKFSARPVGPPSPFTQTDRPNFLHDNLARHLDERGAAFELMVQLRTRPAAQPIEDPTQLWREAEAPFIPVARITIPPQGFDSAEQRAFCENLSFTPWHGIEAFRPLGGINRVRRSVYEAISSLRHALNGAPRVEPTDPAA